MDNERPIEKLLRRYAKKRRDDPAATKLELHPATRRMLQGEVSRQFPKPAASEARSFRGLTSLWPRLVWALPVLVVLGVGVWTIVQSQRSRERAANLAKIESPSLTQLRESQVRTETPAQAIGGVIAPPETGAVTLALADAPRAKDSPSTFGREEEKLKADRTSALTLNTPAPSAVADAAPAPAAAHLDSTSQEKAITSRNTLEQSARDARADKSRDLTLATRRTPAEEPSAGARVETARTLPAATAEDLRVARRIGGKAGSTGTDLAGTSLRATPQPAAAPPLSLSVKSALVKAESDRAPAVPETVVQRFVQTTAALTSAGPATKSAEPPAVLDAFQLEQTGNQLRVIDSDGSSYSGSIQFATGEASYDSMDETKKTADFKNSKLYRQAAGEKRLGVQAGQPTPIPSEERGRNYFFRVTGTNRTLKQPVAFTGNLLVLTNTPLPATQPALTLAPTAKSQFPQTQSASSALLNSSISGKVQLGTDKEMLINAVPARQ